MQKKKKVEQICDFGVSFSPQQQQQQQQKNTFYSQLRSSFHSSTPFIDFDVVRLCLI